CVNTELEAELGLDIKGYADLMDPALKGKIIFSDPTSSSAAWNNLSSIFAAFGNDSDKSWEVIEGLLENGMVVGPSSSTCFKGVQEGEYVVGLTYEDGASTLLKAGADNIKMVYPEEGASAYAFAVSIVKDAPNMDAAKAMIDYLQSAEGQSFRANYVGTVRFTNKDVVVKDSFLPSGEEIRWVARDIDWLIKNKESMLEKWTALYNKYNG
ncbi:MAG TPA: ABC transporter substrate-binding protein, partial [Firmicutes bacterium]|nr:ABC transporter substrate-binding protein [Bacillota bacterium]